MKTNGTLYIVALVLLSLVTALPLSAQPKYDFRNATKIAGMDRKVGAQYRFPNVSAGTDALVTITDITGGVTLNTLDATSSGFAEALQPTITIPAHSSGYVEFTIVFVTTGTTNPVMQTEVPITPIDVDGETNIVYEFDEIKRSGASYVDYTMTGIGVQITYPTTDWIKGINTSGITYNGIDTSAKGVMFSVINLSTNTVVVRTGANNVSGQSQQRLRSLYFQKFYYPNSVLSYTPVVPFPSTTSTGDPVLKVFPSIFKNSITLKIKVNKTGTAQCKLIDYCGRTMKQQDIPVKAGSNTIAIAGLDNVSSGNYIVLINADSKVLNQKITKQ
jgi:hypothetical protein